jgi:hypothetical protein
VGDAKAWLWKTTRPIWARTTFHCHGASENRFEMQTAFLKALLVRIPFRHKGITTPLSNSRKSLIVSRLDAIASLVGTTERVNPIQAWR